MPFELLNYQLLLPQFALVLARVGGLVMGVPVLSSQQVPTLVKVWLIGTLSIMAFPTVSHTLPGDVTMAQAVPGMVGEFMIGHILGFAASGILYAAQIGGNVLSHQSGMALGTVFNPLFDSESTVLDQVWFFTAMAIFLALRGHVAATLVLLKSFENIPPMLVGFDGSLADLMVQMITHMFELAIRLVGPVVLTLFLTSLLMGFLTKTMPQMNLLSVGFSIRVAAVLFAGAITLSFSGELFADAVDDSLNRIAAFFEDAAAMGMRAAHAG